MIANHIFQYTSQFVCVCVFSRSNISHTHAIKVKNSETNKKNYANKREKKSERKRANTWIRQCIQSMAGADDTHVNQSYSQSLALSLSCSRSLRFSFSLWPKIHCGIFALTGRFPLSQPFQYTTHITSTRLTIPTQLKRPSPPTAQKLIDVLLMIF